MVIGRTSYGKGTVQKLYTLRGGEDRVRMKATVAEYKLHGGVEVHDTGIPTDLTMRRVVFNGSGRLDSLRIEAALSRCSWRSMSVWLADRRGVREERRSVASLARRLVLSTVGPTRQDGLEAIRSPRGSGQGGRGCPACGNLHAPKY